LEGEASDSDGNIATYLWTQVGGPNTANIVDPGSAITTVEGLVAGVYVFDLTVTDDGGVTASDQVQVTVGDMSLADVVFPKIFSPNNDGINDFWTWENPSQFEGCVLTIYTSSGNKVYEKVSYDNSWNGLHDGKPLEAGGYYFVLKCREGQQTTGGVRIVR
jgi:gliding motility-associated-like protein